MTPKTGIKSEHQDAINYGCQNGEERGHLRFADALYQDRGNWGKGSDKKVETHNPENGKGGSHNDRIFQPPEKKPLAKCESKNNC
jgi:hypothetical protein